MRDGVDEIEDREQRVADQIAALSRQVDIRVLNCGPRGCLVEASRPLSVGTVATLRIALSGQEFDDVAQVIRCQTIRGAGSTYHIAMQFLSTTPPHTGTLRHGIRREMGELVGSLVARS